MHAIKLVLRLTCSLGMMFHIILSSTSILYSNALIKLIIYNGSQR